MYVVVETSGTQFKCEEGETLRLDRIDGEVGAEVTFDRVMLVRTDDSVSVGTPTVDGGKVVGTIIEHGKGYARRIGYRAHFTDVRIERIEV